MLSMSEPFLSKEFIEENDESFVTPINPNKHGNLADYFDDDSGRSIITTGASLGLE